MQQSTSRLKLFCIGRAHETLPPTSDAAKFHIMRAHYQASVWNQAHLPYPDLPPVTEMGWMHLGGQLVQWLLSLPPIQMLAGRSRHVVVGKGASANAAAAGKFAWNASRHAIAVNLATTAGRAGTLVTTRNNFMQLPYTQ